MGLWLLTVTLVTLTYQIGHEVKRERTCNEVFMMDFTGRHVQVHICQACLLPTLSKCFYRGGKNGVITRLKLLGRRVWPRDVFINIPYAAESFVSFTIDYVCGHSRWRHHRCHFLYPRPEQPACRKGVL